MKLSNIVSHRFLLYLVTIKLYILPYIKTTKDPFSVLGIPSLNPSQIFKEEMNFTPKYNQVVNIIKSIEDIPKFLQNSNLSKEEELKVISRFLLADDYMLKKFGAVFDQSGFDGVISMESISPVGNPERLIQRARSAAKIFTNNYLKQREYDAYGGELQKADSVGWQVYKILMISRKAVNDHIFLRVCLPLDEYMVALVSDFKDNCLDKIKYEEEGMIKNKSYLEKIQKSNIFPMNKNNSNLRSQTPSPNQENLLNNFKQNIGKFMNVSAPNSINKNTSMMKKNNLNSFKNINQDSPTFLMKSEQRQPNLNATNFGQKLIQTSSPIAFNNLIKSDYTGLEAKVEGINEKLNKLENRVEKDEKVTESTKEDIKDLKQNLDRNFNKLDGILEKLATKLK